MECDICSAPYVHRATTPYGKRFVVKLSLASHLTHAEKQLERLLHDKRQPAKAFAAHLERLRFSYYAAR